MNENNYIGIRHIKHGTTKALGTYSMRNAHILNNGKSYMTKRKKKALLIMLRKKKCNWSSNYLVWH